MARFIEGVSRAQETLFPERLDDWIGEDHLVRVVDTNACKDCALKSRCTTGQERRVSRWEHEDLVEASNARRRSPSAPMSVRRSTVEQRQPSTHDSATLTVDLRTVLFIN